jgi:hypothetical protein
VIALASALGHESRSYLESRLHDRHW